MAMQKYIYREIKRKAEDVLDLEIRRLERKYIEKLENEQRDIMVEFYKSHKDEIKMNYNISRYNSRTGYFDLTLKIDQKTDDKIRNLQDKVDEITNDINIKLKKQFNDWVFSVLTQANEGNEIKMPVFEYKKED